MARNESQIRWKQGDYIKLGKAVANFNNKINRLNEEEQRLYLPEIAEYKEIKQNITTRKELNRVLRSLRSFNKEGAEDLYTTQAGEEITKWEYNKLNKQIKIATGRLNEEIKELNKPTSSGYSKAQMGSLEYQEILAQIRNLKKLETLSGKAFTRLKDRISNLGNLDYRMIKATIYRENFMKAIEYSKDLEGYNLLMKKFNRIKNPVNFFNYVQKSDVLTDIFLFYKPR